MKTLKKCIILSLLGFILLSCTEENTNEPTVKKMS